MDGPNRQFDRASLHPGDALLVVDAQCDFVGGALPVPGARGIVPVIARYVQAFRDARLPVVASRDWHPRDHCSFRAQGGPWPAHCVAGTPGADFAPGLESLRDAWIVSKGTAPGSEAYSAFQGTDLDRWLRRIGVRRLCVAGFATDHCVRATVLDALRLGFGVDLLTDAIRAVDPATPALREMEAAGANPISLPLALADLAHG